MIIIKCSDGLGNQMFQYAFGKAQSLKQDTEMSLDIDSFHYNIRSFDLHIFNIKTKNSTKGKPRYVKLWKNKFLDKIQRYIIIVCKRFDKRYVLENSKYPTIWPGMYDYRHDIYSGERKGTYYEGYRQDPRYFEEYADIIRNDFSLKTPISDKLNLERIKSINSTNAVSLHVRRTDFLGSQYDGICDINYYKNSIDYIVNRIDSPFFYIFSDDIERCQNNISTLIPSGIKSMYIDGNNKGDSYKDMMLMSYCQHNIIANSTYSRRGAWLNCHPKKIVISPKKFNNHVNINGLIHNNWIKM